MTLASDVTSMAVGIGGTIGEGQPINNQPFNQFVGFGDSTTDSGYFFTHPISNNSTLEAQYQASVAAGGGLPTSLGGMMNSTLLAQDFGLTAIPVGEPGGTNYAASGATITGVLNSNSLAPSIVSQIQSYLASVNNQANPNALYEISGGVNDEKVAAALNGAAAQDAYMIQQANTFAQVVEQLYADGARYILILDAGNAVSNLGNIFNQTLYSDLVAAGVSFMHANPGQNVINVVDANPTAYGITSTVKPPSGPFTPSNPYEPANGGADINPIPSMISSGWSLYATQLASPNAGQTDLYADDGHLSAIGQQLEANYFYNLIENKVPTVGETLTATANVVANSSGQFTYQWQSLAAGQTTWTNIAGATGSTFVVQQADLGMQLRLEATYTDSAGASTAVSQATPAVVLPDSSILAATSDTGAQTASGGHLVTVTMSLSAPATVTGTPTLHLNDNEVAYYTGGSGTDTLTFAYLPLPTDNISDLQVTSLNVPLGASISGFSGTVTGDLGLTIEGTLTPATVAQEINGLYLTLYGIAATQAGISFWEAVLQNFDPSVTAANAATTAISVNDETYLGQQMTAGSPIVNGTTYFATLYPASMSDMAFVQALYQNMSNFIGTAAGDNYWLGLLQQAEAANGGNVIAARESIAGQFVHDFMSDDLTVGAAALNVSQSDYTLLVNGQLALLGKAAVSQYYANETGTTGGSIINYTTVTAPAFTAAHNVLTAITSDSSTVAIAITGINNAIAHQDLNLI